jgi:hypothetical protein
LTVFAVKREISMAKKTSSVRRAAARATTFRMQGPARPVTIKHLDQPPKIVSKKKKIHRRHILPLIQEGMEREFHSTTPPLRAKAMTQPMVAADELTILVNTELTGPTQQDTASNVGEPSVAVNGNVVFYTGNWYAAVSTDGGATFRFIDPETSFKDPGPNSQFCCDQVVHYISQIDTFVWLLQYGPDTGDNIQRLAFATTTDVVNGRWRPFDVTTKSLGVEGAFLDFPDLAVGASSLYMTTNIFGADGQTGSAVVRIPFSAIKSGKVTAQHFVSMELQSFRVAQNCGAIAFFASHRDTSTLAVFSWPENQSQPTSTSVGVARWIGGNGYRSRTPDGSRWLDRADPRITGATLTRNDLWFAWSVDGGSNQRPNPFIQIAKINAANLTLIDNINIFDSDSATCYGALSTNANDEVGISYMIGGGSRFPSHVVGILTGTRSDVVAAEGERAPQLDPQNGKGEWGDYLTVRRAFPNQQLFAATGYTMKGTGDGSNRDVTPRLVIFGRASGAGAGAGGGAAVDGGQVQPGALVDTEAERAIAGPAFRDVNALPIVNAQVAAAVKAAAMAEGQRAMPEAAIASQIRMVTKPGVERWPVKTGTDSDVALVGKNIVQGHSLGAGIVDATVEELIRIPRSGDMTPPTSEFAPFQERRKAPVETTVWRLEAHITAVKLEADGDYHLVLQGASGQTMVAEIPTPQPPFVDASSPWTVNMKAARKVVDEKILNKISPASFVRLDDSLVPRESLSAQAAALAMPMVPAQFRTPEEGAEALMPTFKTRIDPVRVRITGVGFFDKVHGQMGVSLLNGIELHPVLKIEFPPFR